MTQAIEQVSKQGQMSAELAEKVLVGGDLSKLDAGQRLEYIHNLCDSLGLSAVTRPFQYITLQGKLTLYATKDATEQLRKLHNVSITRIDKEMVGDVYIVTAYASTPGGRTDSDVGAVTAANLRGDALANAIMKAITKAKRRVTLSICGLGMLDETEIETIPSAHPHPEMTTEYPSPPPNEPKYIPVMTNKVVEPVAPVEVEVIPAPSELLRRYNAVMQLAEGDEGLKSKLRAKWREIAPYGKGKFADQSDVVQWRLVEAFEDIVSTEEE
jgi:hypothetical protein